MDLLRALFQRRSLLNYNRAKEVRHRHVDTIEEHAVWTILLVSFFAGFFLMALSNHSFALGTIFPGMNLSAPLAMLDFEMRALVFQVIVSIPFAVFARFSKEQKLMMTKITLLIGVLYLSLCLLAVFLFYVVEITRTFFIDVIGVLGFVALIAFLKKSLGSLVREWVSIKYIPANTSLNAADKHLIDAKARIEQRHFKGASDAFRAAAVVYVRLEDWQKTAENYWSAAEILSEEPDVALDSHVAWLYALSAAAYLLNRDFGKAEKALKLGRGLLASGEIEKSKFEKLASMFDFLEALQKQNAQQISEMWRKLARRIGKWDYPIMDETILLLEKNMDAIYSK